jgi:hypothetical protein
MAVQQPLADRLALPILLFGAVAISFSGIFVKLSEVGPISTGFYRMALPLPVMAIGLWIARASTRRTPAPTHLLARLGWHPRGGLLSRLRPHRLALVAETDRRRHCHVAGQYGADLGRSCRLPVFPRALLAALLIGLAVALGGVVLLVLGGDRSLAVGDWLGLMLATLGAIGYAGYLRGVKAARNTVGLAQVMFWTSACTALWLLPAALLTEDRIVPQTLHGWLAVAGLAFVSQTIGQGLISWALGHLPAAFSSVSLLLNPVASGIFAWIILGEALTAAQISGGFAVLFGIFVARPRSQGPASGTIEDAPPPKPVAPST